MIKIHVRLNHKDVSFDNNDIIEDLHHKLNPKQPHKEEIHAYGCAKYSSNWFGIEMSYLPNNLNRFIIPSVILRPSLHFINKIVIRRLSITSGSSLAFPYSRSFYQPSGGIFHRAGTAWLKSWFFGAAGAFRSVSNRLSPFI